MLARLENLKHSDSNDITHDLVAFSCEMQSIIPELFAQILVDTIVPDRAVKIKRMTIERYGQPSQVWKPEATRSKLSKGPGTELVDVLSLLLVAGYHAVQGDAIRVRSSSRARGFQYIQRKDIRSSLQCDVPHFLCEDQVSSGTI